MSARTVPTALRLALAGAAAALLLAGCVAGDEESTAPPEDASTSADEETSAGGPEDQEPDGDESPTPDVLEQRVWLYDLRSLSDRPSGQQTVGVVAGGDRYDDSTTQWVGCDGDVDRIEYELEGRYTRLVGAVGAREGVPGSLVVEVVIAGDDRELDRIRVDAGGVDEIDLDLTGVRTLTITATAVEGVCGTSDESYLVLADTYVS